MHCGVGGVGSGWGRSHYGFNIKMGMLYMGLIIGSFILGFDVTCGILILWSLCFADL